MPIQKTCKQCENKFTIEDEDLAFYKKISPTFAGKIFEIPPPTMCPDCRRQRRLACRNVTKLYKRKSDLSDKEIVSPYAPNSRNIVYDNSEWWSDKWDPMGYGKDFDFSRSFFEQFAELYYKVPVSSRNVTLEEKSDFTNNATGLKKCYLLQNSNYSENCYYGVRINYSADCIDNYNCIRSENCYECVNIENCYNCYFSSDCANCRDSILLDNCIACKDCYGSANLNNKQYWVNNREGTKEEFEKLKDKFLNADLPKRAELIEEARDFLKTQPKRFAHIYKSENVSGDYISNSKNIFCGFLINDCEDLRYCHNIISGKDSIDHDIWGNHSEYIIDCDEVGEHSRNIYFSRLVEASRDIFYSIGIFGNSRNCFGCAGLRHAEYCIFNKQYSCDEYEKLAAKIIEYMKKTDEWGEFFPMKYSPYGYNESHAHDFFPLTKEETVKLGANWQDEDFLPEYGGVYYEANDIRRYKSDINPDAQDEIDQVLKGVVKCRVTGKPFKIQARELAFYIRSNIQIPNIHPDQRHTDRFKLTNPLKVWHRKCMNEGCKNEFETTYAPERPEKVYCEDCYQKSVI